MIDAHHIPTPAETAARRGRLGIAASRAVATSPFLARVRSGARTVYDEPAGPPDLKGIARRAGMFYATLPCVPGLPAKPEKIRYFVSEILAACCTVRGVSLIDLISARRQDKIVKPRQEAAWLVKELTVLSLPQIGHHMGGRDHTTILHAVRQHQRRVDAGLVDTLRDIKPVIDAARQAAGVAP